jgi:hypothetical protein
MPSKCVFVSADHGLAVFYFLQSDVVTRLLDAGVEVVVLTEDNSREQIESRFGRPGLVVEGLRLDRVQDYVRKVSPARQWWLDFLRRAGAAGRANLAVVHSYIRQVKSEAHPRRRRLFPAMETAARFRAAIVRPGRLWALPDALHREIYADLSRNSA